jgi:hypothetical protein
MFKNDLEPIPKPLASGARAQNMPDARKNDETY